MPRFIFGSAKHLCYLRIDGQKPSSSYDPFDSCSVAQWTVYAVIDENPDAWLALGYPYYYDELRFDEGILLDEGHATASVNQNALMMTDDIHRSGVPSAWECAIWADFIDPDEESWIYVAFKGESWEGVPFFLWIVYSKDSQHIEWELEEWAEKWRQAYIIGEFIFSFDGGDTHEEEIAYAEQVIEMFRQEYGGQPCGP